MASDIPSILSHVSLGVTDLARSIAFYDQVMPTIGAVKKMDVPEIGVAYGKAYPEFWIQRPIDGQPAGVGNGTHIAFLTGSTDEVDAFHAAALAAGGTDDGMPGWRPQYSPAYYACFVRDPDGHKIEAMFWDAEKAKIESHTG
ncbi:VOC family protein [Rhodobium gokarnense]|uniref:Catechol 2,3-dioxygenase-like lactoylglutathione lyase family enzyme n=1 Tax=Rhodobium gokarnense TaxID=364296 RepID=A0ABT3HDF9_9HYPH|nr:VOC family protein [Rhodobium gokarnense]MCW2308359.1 catechol 2,3-dioxygenase-like lactoylglutathione lyase family enzyme [Rhodobium gokarnense]